jgi:hypothetical protein
MLPSITEILADGVAVVHAAILVLYVAGAVSALRGGFCRRPLLGWQFVYLGLVLLTSLSVLLTESCCLTQLENALRAVNRPDTCYDGSFLEHYVPNLPESVDAVGSILLLLAGCLATLSALWSWSQESESKPNRALHQPV